MIELKNISKTYKTSREISVHALKDVSITIKKGEFVAIMGASGTGKSTLLHILGLFDRPDKGSYILQGKDISRFSDDELAITRNKVAGFVFQQFHLLQKMSAVKNVELPLIYAGKKHLKSKAVEKLEAVGLGKRIDHNPNQLSGGEQQRVAIARALVNDPEILFADEPTGNLDTKSEAEIMGILKDLNNQGKTIVMVTHEREVAEKAERIIVMKDGLVISDEYQNGFSKEEYKDNTEKLNLDDTDNNFNGISILDYFRMAVYATWSHKLRSFLSMLGILIGVSSVIAMLAVGRGAKESISKSLASLGSNLLIVRPGSAHLRGISLGAGAVTSFTYEDSQAILKLQNVKRTGVSVSGRGQIVYGDKNWNTQILGVSVDYPSMHASVPASGRFFNISEQRSRDRVAVIGETIVKQLFGDKFPLGQIIKINRNSFKVIGVLPQKGASGFRDQDDIILVPYTTAMYRLFGKVYVDSIDVEVKSAEFMNSVTDEIKKYVIKKQHLTKDKEESFQIRNMADIQETLQSTTKTMTLLLGIIAAISLLVGGIGIMNIMLVSVTERIKEIGLRKAIGARRKDIMLQFLIEAIFLTFCGGIAGIVIGMLAAFAVSHFLGWTVVISIVSVILAAGFSVGVGIAFGVWPARYASMLNPVEALRYE